MSVLKVCNLKKCYGTEPNIIRALNGINLSIEQGEFVAVVGTSGSGKSTLLNVMGGLDIIKAASEGDVEAINRVLKHYEGYIVSLSTRKMYDENGHLHFCVDETLRRRLETKLITKILDFKIA